jgi:nucleotide-binding universal stress UspA family protein
MLIHVVRAPQWQEEIRADSVGTLIKESIRDEGRTILAAALALLTQQGIQADATLEESSSAHASEQIVRCAESWRADLIVMGTHGRSGMSRLVLGSTAAEVVRIANIPVLLLR